MSRNQIKEKTTQLCFVENLILAGCLSTVSKIVFTPLDKICVIDQIKSPNEKTFDVLKKNIIERGFSYLWRYNRNLIRVVPIQALNFAFYHQIKRSLIKPYDTKSSKIPKCFLSGGLAGAICLLISFESPKAVKHAIHHNKTIIEKIKGHYKGYVMSCVGVFIYRAIYFGLYDTLNETKLRLGSGCFAAFGLAYIVSVFAGLVSYPIDIVGRILKTGNENTFKYDNVIKMIKNEGFSVLFKRSRYCLLWSVNSAAVLSGYDTIAQYYVRNKK